MAKTFANEPGKSRLILAGFCLLLAASLACSLTGADPTEAPVIEEVEGTASTTPESTADEGVESEGIPLSACESIPNAAVVAFLYDLAVPTVIFEQEADGVYCRFETIDLDGPAGDLGRSRAVATLKLWDSYEACTSVSPVDEATEIASPPSPWSYLKVVAWPDKPELILSITAYDGDHCISVAAGDISSQPLEHWLQFIGEIADSL